MKTYLTMGIAIITLIFATGTAVADDMWSETPDLNSIAKPSVTIEPNKLLNKKSAVDIWAETPDLNDTNEEYSFKFLETVVKTGIAHSEFYAETPDLNKVTPSKNGSQPTNDSMIAKKENKQK
jgi:hypothetical protein